MIHIKAKVNTRENINVNVSEPENISAEVDSINFAGVRSINGMTGDVEIPSADAYTKEETNALLAEKANSSDLSRVATTGNYNDLSNKPTIPTVPAKVSAFQNDAGYLTQHQSLEGYATEAWVSQQGYLTQHQSLSGYATETWVNQQGFLTQHQDLSAYATKAYVDGLVGDIESLLEAI